MSENTKIISEKGFAEALIRYVKANPDLNVLTSGCGCSGISDHWTMSVEGASQVPNSACLVPHGLFDHLFKRTAPLPDKWKDFERQFLSPEMYVLDKIYSNCQQPIFDDLTKREVERKSFFMHNDFWKNKTQKINFSRIIDSFKEKKMITKPSRKYRDDPGAVGLMIGDAILDIPSSYSNLRSLMSILEGGLRSIKDIPQDIERYNTSTPLIFLLADNLELDKEKEAEKYNFLKLLQKHTKPSPKFQTMVYVLAEKRKDKIIPRDIGYMSMYMLEIYSGTPVGSKVSDVLGFPVPNSDMHYEEIKSLDCSQRTWKVYQKSLFKKHPKILEEIKKQKN